MLDEQLALDPAARILQRDTLTPGAPTYGLA